MELGDENEALFLGVIFSSLSQGSNVRRLTLETFIQEHIIPCVFWHLREDKPFLSFEKGFFHFGLIFLKCLRE